ncbi:MAG: flagellar biosynthesis anti-sigma factor FlgM [Lachnospiraceae bacterium]|nr:flagellar biosynthesis anti-sigma factor FlgM [Lachnospiraceae bacterium]
MRIEAYTQVQQLYNTKNTGKAKQAAAAGFSDQLQISSLGKDIQTAKQAVNNAPDVREDVTAPIKESIKNGTYEVSGDSFADKLFEKYNQQGISF